MKTILLTADRRPWIVDKHKRIADQQFGEGNWALEIVANEDDRRRRESELGEEVVEFFPCKTSHMLDLESGKVKYVAYPNHFSHGHRDATLKMVKLFDPVTCPGELNQLHRLFGLVWKEFYEAEGFASVFKRFVARVEGVSK